MEAAEPEYRRRLSEIVRATLPLMRVLETARALDLRDHLVFSGAVYQPVLNHLTGRPPGYGLSDYDLGYFDAADLSYDAEDAVIRRMRAALPEELRGLVEARNQARVHLWFEGHFGEPYTALSSTAEAIERFTSATFALGVRLRADDELHIVAPFGLADLFAMRLPRNPWRETAGYARTCADVRRRWPELAVVDAPPNPSSS